ncbi:MAG TPA: branched-chain amino acid ABC transporter permease [Mycobacteriales bacterium]|jgi:branched-chain amino acid transport system permease protein|nr:branched-chain amino acid ABC transporter permease [Mycobacteriales bacterium]
MSVAMNKGASDTRTPSAAPAPASGGRLRSTGLKHLLLMLAAFFGLVLLLLAVDEFRATQLASLAYYIPAVAGLTVLTGINGQVSLGHGALMAVGAYTTGVLLIRQPDLPYLLIVAIAIIVTALVGALVGVAAARLHGPYLAGATLALAVGLPGLAITFEDLLGGEPGLRIPSPTVPPWVQDLYGNITGDRLTPRVYLAYLGGALALTTLFILSNLVRSRYGRMWRAVRDDEVAAELAGIDLGRARVLAFVVSAACAGLAGALLAVVSRIAAPTGFTVVLSLSLLVAIVIGGLGSLVGAIIGSAMLVYLAPFSIARGRDLGLSDVEAANLAPLIYGVVLIVVMLVAPRGLVGTARFAFLARRAGRQGAGART